MLNLCVQTEDQRASWRNRTQKRQGLRGIISLPWVATAVQRMGSGTGSEEPYCWLAGWSCVVSYPDWSCTAKRKAVSTHAGVAQGGHAHKVRWLPALPPTLCFCPQHETRQGHSQTPRSVLYTKLPTTRGDNRCVPAGLQLPCSVPSFQAFPHHHLPEMSPPSPSLKAQNHIVFYHLLHLLDVFQILRPWAWRRGL